MKSTILLLSALFVLIYTDSRSQVWVQQSSGTNDTLYAVQFTDTLTGILVGGNGSIRKTTNAGTNWFALSSGTTQTLRNIYMLNGNTGFVIGGNGTIRKTTNGGVNWFALSAGTTSFLTSVHAVDQNIIYACGSGGTLIKSTNGGVNWSSQNIGSSNYLRSLYFLNSNTGCVVGDQGTVRRTTNGGINWFAQSVSVAGPLTSVYLNNVNNGIVSIGYLNMAFYRTTNAGVNWVSQYYGSDNSIRDIDFVGDVGYMCGDNGNFYSTFNGGANWSRIPMGVSNWMNGISFPNEQTGWSVGTNGIILKTTTGGANIPNSPTNLVGFAISTSKIYLAWFDNSSNEQGFRIEKRVNGSGSFTLAGTTGSNTLNYIDSTGISPGNMYEYRVAAFTGAGISGYTNIVAIVVTGIEPTGTDIPDSYALYNNYPNPFNPTTKIKFDIPKNDFVSLKVYNMQGQEVGILAQENLSAGRYEMEFNGANLTSGVYFFRLETSSFIDTRKMMLVK
jgi:photosystem II stability/assembly factor-like uncharacterized protein